MTRRTAPAGFEHATILVVDDDALLCRVVERFLRMQGFEVLVENDGFAALAAVAHHQVDLVLLDIEMPGLHGLRVLEMMTKKDRALSVLMMTGHTHVDSAQAARRLGARDYIGKPFDLDVILQAVRETLSAPHFLPPRGAESVFEDLS